MNVISAEELYEIKENEDVLFLDVREQYEIEEKPFKNIHVLHIPMNEIPQSLNKLDDEKHIVVGCVVGGRSATVCDYLKTQGFDKVSNLTGGLLAWQNLEF